MTSPNVGFSNASLIHPWLMLLRLFKLGSYVQNFGRLMIRWLDLPIIQALPIPGLVESQTAYYFIERPWPDADGTLWTCLDKIVFDEPKQTGRWIMDQVVKGATIIVHGVDDYERFVGRAALELKGDCRGTNYSGYIIVADTHHTCPELLIPASATLAALHFQPTRTPRALAAFLNGTSKELDRWLELAKRTGCPVVIEISWRDHLNFFQKVSSLIAPHTYIHLLNRVGAQVEERVL